jgi:hypothetical protein
MSSRGLKDRLEADHECSHFEGRHAHRLPRASGLNAALSAELESRLDFGRAASLRANV